MPELPEVEAARLRCESALLNKKLAKVVVKPDEIVFPSQSAKKLEKSILGARVVGTGRRGKYFWLSFDSGESLLIHLGMSGRVKRGAFSELHSERLLKIVLGVGNNDVIAIFDGRRFSRIRLCADPLQEPKIKRMKFDVLEDAPSNGQIAAMLKKRKRAIKSVLLDQALFAGVGNYIADEVLYHAKIAPVRPASSLTTAEITRLSKALKYVVTTAVKCGADYSKFPNTWIFHRRWSRSGRKNTGREKIIWETVGGRTTAWVPKRQK